MIESKTIQEQKELKSIKSRHKASKKRNSDEYRKRLQELLKSFSDSVIPNWGGLLFNKKRMEV